MTILFDPIKIGAIDAPNRILMAPLTRGRATLISYRDNMDQNQRFTISIY